MLTPDGPGLPVKREPAIHRLRQRLRVRRERKAERLLAARNDADVRLKWHSTGGAGGGG
jgi:hypothetical protein